MTRLALILLAGPLLLGCRSAEPTIDPDLVFGHRYDSVDPEERTVLNLEPPPPGTEYFTYPVLVTDVMIRRGERLPDGRTPVELVLLGVLADACTHLYRADEERLVRLLSLEFEMWREKGARCVQVRRPFRFYYVMDQPLEPGPYTLHVNDSPHPFEIFPMEADE